MRKEEAEDEVASPSRSRADATVIAPGPVAQEADGQDTEDGGSAATPLPDQQASASDARKSPYPAAPEPPTQQGPGGLRFDMNDGCRVALPASETGWRVRISDMDTGNLLFRTEMKEGRVRSSKRYFVRFRLEVWQGDECVLDHEFDARDREVLIVLPTGTLGDSLGWVPYAAKFQAQHGCRLTCAVADRLIQLFQPRYPDIRFVSHADVDPSRFYATYRIGLFFTDKNCERQPCDFRFVGLHRTAGYILGVDPTETPPDIALPDDTRPIAERYVCIAVQSTTQCKYWNNPQGWLDIVAFLRANGYRVICVDGKRVHGAGLMWNTIPNGAEDMTGIDSLAEVARWIKHADFFVGLSSGLSWLAWAARQKVVMISGFTHPTTEFYTPYRVVNYHTCNSCWNDPLYNFDHKDFLWCPRHANTPRQFECTRLITAEQVKATIRRVPGFGSGRG